MIAIERSDPNPAKAPGRATDSAAGGLVRHIVPIILREIPPLPVIPAVIASPLQQHRKKK